jgi:hypothetical protein
VGHLHCRSFAFDDAVDDAGQQGLPGAEVVGRRASGSRPQVTMLPTFGVRTN